MSESASHNPPPSPPQPPADSYDLYHGSPGMPYYSAQGLEDGGIKSLIGELTPARLLRVARGRWLTLLLAAMFALLAAYYHESKKIPLYGATSTIEMTVRRPRVMNAEAIVREGWVNQEEEFTTRIDKFRGPRMREFAQKEYLTLKGETDLTPSESAATLGGVSFNLMESSRLVKISCVNPDPEVASLTVNAYALAAKEMAIAENRAVSEDAVSWLHVQADAQRKKVDTAEQIIFEYRKTKRVAALENEAASIKTAISALNLESVKAKTAEDKALTVLDAIKKNPLTPDSVGKLPSSVPRLSEISKAVQQWAEANQTCDTLLLKYTEEHPRVKTQKDLVKGLREQVKQAAQRSEETATSDLNIAEKAVKTLDSRKKTLEDELSALELTIIERKSKLASLERERNAADIAFQGILNRIQEARLAADEDTATIQISELSTVPKAPIPQNESLTFAVAGIIGLVMGMALALLKDVVDDHIVSPLDIEIGMGIEVLGAIPKMDVKNPDDNADLICLKEKSGHMAELFAGIRGILDLPPLDEHSDSLVVTSTQPGEGKTFNSSNLAIMSARAGRKTLLIDFDLRRPRLRKMFDISTDHPSLMHCLAQKDPALFSALPHSTECPNLDVITTKADTAFSPAEILGNRFVKTFADWANKHYERVIFDSPPLGLLADSIVLSGICKGVLLVCHPNKSKRSGMRHIVKRFQKVNGNIIGVIINNINLGHSGFKKYEQYRYGYGYKYPYGKE